MKRLLVALALLASPLSAEDYHQHLSLRLWPLWQTVCSSSPLTCGSGLSATANNTFSGTNSFTGKTTFFDGANGINIVNAADNTKVGIFDFSGATTGTTQTLAFVQGGTGSIRLGIGTGTNSTILGITATASATQSVAVGQNANASVLQGTALGQNAAANTGTGNTAVGSNTTASGAAGAVSIAYTGSCTGASCVAIGNATAVSVANGVGIGNAAGVSGNGLINLGNRHFEITKTLSNTSATQQAIFQVTVASGTTGGGLFCFSVSVTNGTDFTEDSGCANVSYVNKAGTFSFGTSTVFGDSTVGSAGSTLSNTVASTSPGAGLVNINITPTFSLAATTVKIHATFFQHDTQAVAFQ